MQHVWRRGEMYTGIWWKFLRERYGFEESGLDGRVKLRRKIRKKVWGDIDLIDLAQGRALLNRVTNSWFHKMLGIS
jgi:hypothetical protein